MTDIATALVLLLLAVLFLIWGLLSMGLSPIAGVVLVVIAAVVAVAAFTYIF